MKNALLKTHNSSTIHSTHSILKVLLCPPLPPTIKAGKSLPITTLRKQAQADMQKLKILVAEDDAITLSVVAALLSRWGYEVISVSDGEQARNLLRAGGIRICILDWEMPALNGRDLCAWIHAVEL